MNLVIVHYHLKPGGVTAVIKQQVEAVVRALPEMKITVLVGEGSVEFDTLPCEVVVAPALHYWVPEDAHELKDRQGEIDKVFTPLIVENETVFHFHNPTLGKNPALTGAIHSLCEKAVQIVSTCHDFSEDRPDNQNLNERCASWNAITAEQFLYPDRKNIHYLTINSDDFQRDHWRTLTLSSVDTLFPPVNKTAPGSMKRGEVASWLSLDSDKEWLFYPIRAIKRKNIGELILLALLDEGKREWLIARAPQNELEIPLYRKWVALAQRLAIPVHFDVVSKIPFHELMNHCDRVITTSVREGFGMAYLEPWYIGTPVCGRELPMVVNDMREKGVFQDLLYTHLLVPESETLWDDFGFLSVDVQMALIERIAQSEELREMIRTRGTWWNTLFDEVSAEVIEHNKRIIDEEFSGSAYGRKLAQLYRRVLSA